MKAFGLELRRANNMRNLYKDVDRILSKVPPGEVTKDVQADAVAHALHAMMQPGKWFDVCAVREASELTGVFISSERMNVYRLAHCISWEKMTPEYRQTLMAMVLDDFRSILYPEDPGTQVILKED